jgi:hypothetical protein
VEQLRPKVWQVEMVAQAPLVHVRLQHCELLVQDWPVWPHTFG